MIKTNDEAVSPVIGVILMVAVTIIIATVVAAFIFGFSSDRPNGKPMVAVKAENVPETPGIVDMKIQLNGGDRLVSGDWRLSIVPAGETPVYRASSTDLRVGDQIITYNMTSGTGNYTVTNSSVYTNGVAGNLTTGARYDVKIIVYPFKALVLDTVVEVR